MQVEIQTSAPMGIKGQEIVFEGWSEYSGRKGIILDVQTRSEYGIEWDEYESQNVSVQRFEYTYVIEVEQQ